MTDDRGKIIAAIAVFAAGVLGYYLVPVRGTGFQASGIQIGSLVLGALLGAGIYATTDQFSRFRHFVRQARAELSRVVWPSRQETIQTTAVVILMVLFVGAFLWVVDWIVFSAVRLVMG